MSNILQAYQCECAGTRFIPRDFSIDKENGVDEPHAEQGSIHLHIGARCVKCDKIYDPEFVRNAYNSGFDFFINPM